MTVRTFMVSGDSLTQGTVNNTVIKPLISEGGPGNWVERIAEMLANLAGIGPLISSGIRPIYLGIGLAANVSPEWTFGGSWTAVASTDAWDKLPYGQGQYANGSTFTATYTRTAFMRTNVGFALYWVDYTNGGNWQYRIDGGTWTNMGQTLAHDNKLCAFYINTPFTSTVDIRANDGAAGVGCFPAGIEVFYLAPSTTQGLVVHNVAQGGQTLHALTLATSGDRMAIFDSVKAGTGSPLLPTPNAGCINMNINDVPGGLGTTQYATDLTTYNTRVSPLGPVGLMNPYEVDGPTYSVYPQATQTSFRNQLKTTGATLSANVFDLQDQWSNNGWTTSVESVAAGLLRSEDALHELRAGHIDISTRVYWWIREQFLALGNVPSTYTVSAKQPAVQYAGKLPAVQYSAAAPIGVT